TFNGAIAEGPIFIKFFAPWCGHCKKLAPTWTQVAAKMRGRLTIAEVDCDAHNALCRQQGVEGYPQLFFYSGGKKMEYTGSRSLEPLEKYAMKAAAPAVETISYPTFKKLLKDEDVFMVYVYSGDKTYDALVEDASKPLVGSPSVYKSTDARISDLFKDVQLPSILVFKSGEPHAKLHLASYDKADRLTKWMMEKRLPLALELSPDNFQDVMKSPARPLVVLTAYDPADPNAEQVEASVKSFADKWSKSSPGAGREVVHVWMDGVRWDKWLNSMYGIAAPMPKVVIVDHSRLVYYDTDAKGKPIEFEATSVRRALVDARSGITPPKYSENILERYVRWIGDSFTSSFEAVQNNILVSLVAVGALLVVISAAFKRCLRVDKNVYVPHHTGRLD
ncbi:thioredoxin-domain-containing protein, partial [Exidia glandulosa HHB12029]